ncbi:bifunctional phosphopantothenoylcysteine decarboxylase/phosphopantothenate--cysteine ligase CoaBC [Nakamurella deserti]|uniref:bifunctional phosphopantothenoylcysteine decarboxylase/phosphopantothenate--cysteine ligase CoaBC n=1 Tax=Nakamurella deserti TaxID=2164074 RepID=UPI000DBE8238|nr:bifunctional phosphopantothenoylcysteine decarboxylase/phosphopantothenate--cysteine ligase CoaBC [Nakamurella deserti]
MTSGASAAAPRVVLGVGGGIAAYKSAEVVRRLAALGAQVTVTPTAAALRFVGAATFEALSGRPVLTDVFTDVPSVAHVHTGQDADLIVVAPATADLMARAAHGFADDMLTATLLVTRAPVLMVPAMHTEMWAHPATVANVATLRARGVVVLDPAVGRLTGPDSGPGRMPEPEQIAAVAELLLHRRDALPRDLEGVRVLISAGGTREDLDPVRYLTNRSSGRQGFALAQVAASRGADVTLVAANTALLTPPGVHVVPVTDARELHTAMLDRTGAADVVVMAAAVADFRPATRAAAKIKKTGDDGAPTLELVRNPDVLVDLVAARRPDQLIVGFAAETGDAGADVLTYAREKLARKGCDLLVVNRVDGGRGFDTTDNAVTVLSAGRGTTGAGEGSGDAVTEVPFGPKTVVASAVWDVVAQRIAARSGAG